MSKRLAGVAAVFLFWGSSAQAGMTVYDLSDVVRLRLEDISFFALILLLASFGVRFQWNHLAKDFTRLPRLSWFKALNLTGLLSLFMLLILIMIAGARELLTPGAWYRQGSHYRPAEAASAEIRQQNLENLRTLLLQYAYAHDKHFPEHDYISEIPANAWQAPDSAGTRYVYIGGLSLSHSNAMVVCEPANFGEERFVLFGSGNIKRLKTPEIHKLAGFEKKL